MASPDFIVGIIGNIISVLLCASPMGTFWEMIQKKSGEGHIAYPYIAQLLCKTLWTFYGVLDPNGLLIVTVNSVGVFSNSIYVLIYLIYAPNDKRVKALIFVGIVNLCFPGVVMTIALLGFKGGMRDTFIGFICAAVTIAMYAAPLSVMWTVVKTKNVKHMPFALSLFLLLNAGAWFTFALLLTDHFVIVPNAIGILSGSAQIIIYLVYKDKSPAAIEKSVHSIEEGSPTTTTAKAANHQDGTNQRAQNRNYECSIMAEPTRADSFRIFISYCSLSPRQHHSGPLLMLP